jgi:hypothetical protein
MLKSKQNTTEGAQNDATKLIAEDCSKCARVGEAAYNQQRDKAHLIGSGGQANVFYATRKCDGKRFAMKVSMKT